MLTRVQTQVSLSTTVSGKSRRHCQTVRLAFPVDVSPLFPPSPEGDFHGLWFGTRGIVDIKLIIYFSRHQLQNSRTTLEIRQRSLRRPHVDPTARVKDGVVGSTWVGADTHSYKAWPIPRIGSEELCISKSCDRFQSRCCRVFRGHTPMDTSSFRAEAPYFPEPYSNRSTGRHADLPRECLLRIWSHQDNVLRLISPSFYVALFDNSSAHIFIPLPLLIGGAPARIAEGAVAIQPPFP